jgi:hypothetical protein
MLKVTGAEGFAVLLMLALTGCASASVQPTVRGALIGALSGATLGAGTGLLVSDPDLLGSAETPESGDLGLGAGESVAAGATIGLVFGALVGAMIGHGSEDEYPLPPEQSHAGESRIRTAGDPQRAAPHAY